MGHVTQCLYVTGRVVNKAACNLSELCNVVGVKLGWKHYSYPGTDFITLSLLSRYVVKCSKKGLKESTNCLK